jgi:hypothetical protein
MIIQKLMVALATLVLSLPGWACSPPPQRDASGFVRHLAERLPKNARGIMFQLASGTPRASDFRVTSAEDKRALKLRVRPVNALGWVRLELAGGFQPGARYRFRYLPPHGYWVYPDEASVAIGADTVATGGQYAIELAPQPVHRMVTVTTSSGSCVEPAPAVVQEFTYTVPPALEAYRGMLQYDVTMSVSKAGMVGRPDEYLDAWKNGPSIYDMGSSSLGWGYDYTYNNHDNAVVAPCGKQWPAVRLHAAVRFPEVDESVYRTRDADVDLNHNIQGRCGRLETLLQTVDRQAPDPVLRRLCRIYLAGGGAKPLRDVELDEWVFHLGFLANGISPTCDLVALAHLWHPAPAGPQALDAIGLALQKGLAGAEPADRDDALHALAYLVDQLPLANRGITARRLLAPSQPLFVKVLAEPQPARPDELARLIASSGNLPAAERRTLRKTAEGATPGAVQARRILAGQPDWTSTFTRWIEGLRFR